MHYAKRAHAIRHWRSPLSRRLHYLEHVLADDEHAKEVRLFELGPTLLDRYRRFSEELFNEEKRMSFDGPSGLRPCRWSLRARFTPPTRGWR
jgi:ATP-binding cassette subfamily B protein